MKFGKESSESSIFGSLRFTQHHFRRGLFYENGNRNNIYCLENKPSDKSIPKECRMTSLAWKLTTLIVTPTSGRRPVQFKFRTMNGTRTEVEEHRIYLHEPRPTRLIVTNGFENVRFAQYMGKSSVKKR